MELTNGWRALFVQHQDDCPPGYVGERLEQRGATVEVVDARSGQLPDPREFGLVVSLGSDDSAYDESVPYLRRESELLATCVAEHVPVFGICFGSQLLTRVLGGSVYRSPDGPEIGWLSVDSTDPSLVESGPWLVWHLDVMGPPPNGREIARTPVGTQAFVHGPHVGVQFHPEATPDSAAIWADHYRDSLHQVGLVPDELLAETRGRQAEARNRAHALTDRIVDRARVLVGR